MFSRTAPSLTGLSGGGTFSILSCGVAGIGTNPAGGNALTVAGSTACYGPISATGLYTCITDSLTTSDSTLAASATAIKNVSMTANACLPLTGGTVSGALVVTGQLTASNVTVLGTYETVNAYTSHSSNLVISNTLGFGPALSVIQSESLYGAQPVAQFFNGVDPALCIDAAGNVAVNKATSLGYELDCSGTVNATFLRGNGAGITGLPPGSAWTTSGLNTTIPLGSNVGIGTTLPGVALDVSGTIRATTYLGLPAAAASQWGNTLSNVYLGAGSNVGVGTVPNSGYVFDVSGNARVSGATKHVGNVGIGKDASGYALDVSGSVNVSGNLVISNPYFFYSDLQSYSATTLAASASVIVPFTTNTALYNKASQSGFNNTNHTFTIPQSGVWQFNVCVHCYGASANQNLTLQFYNNGVAIGYTLAYYPMFSTGVDMICVNAPLINCAFNDIISITLTNAGTTSINYRNGGRLNYFYGQLICPS